jgi:hypothetical protein
MERRTFRYPFNPQDENKEKGYTSLDILAKRLKEMGIDEYD